MPKIKPVEDDCLRRYVAVRVLGSALRRKFSGLET